MPTLLLSSQKTLQSLNTNEKKAPLSTRIQLERQIEQGSIEAAIQLASITEYKHDMIHGCVNCDVIANYYLMAFRLVKNNSSECNSLLLSLVQQTIGLILCHMDISRIQHLPWLPILMTELRELGKQIKDESSEPDKIVPLPNIHEDTTSIDSFYMDNSMNGEYGRAIRISIYHCRAVLCEDIDTIKSISYYRKCLSVRSSPVESQKLQQSAKVALQHLITDGQKYAANRPRLPSRTSSVSSGASSSCSMACANCGVEKRGMPVCSKCKSQYYCGVRCLKAHKPVHDLECCNH